MQCELGASGRIALRLLTAVALAAGAAASLTSQDLFFRQGVVADGRTERLQLAPALRREPVRVDLAILGGEPPALWLELEPGDPRPAFLIDFERAPDGGLVWRGQFADDPPGYRSITLTQHDRLVHGSFDLGDRRYALRPAARGRGMELVTAAVDGPWSCATEDHSLDLRAGSLESSRSPAPVETDGAADGNRMALLILYIPSVGERWGGRPYAIAYAHHAADMLTTFFRNSLIDAGAYVAEVREWDPGIDHMPQILSRAQTNVEVRRLRDESRADLVVVLVDSSVRGGCGQAEVMRIGQNVPAFAGQAVSVTSVDCESAAHKIFVHEIGHNLGAQHPPELTPDAPELAVFPYAFGHLNTVMNVGPALFFSNPALSFGGEPAGVENEQDNARALRQTIPVVAAFRSGGSPLPRGDVPPPIDRPPIVPGEPTDLRATALSSTEIALQWQDNASDEIAFRLEVRSLGGPWQLLAELPPDTVEFVAAALEPATTYRFRARALGAEANSRASNVASATTLPGAPTSPTGLVAESPSPGAVLLQWQPVPRASGYELEVRAPDPADDRAAIAVAHDLDGVTLSDLAASTPYTFRVRAVGGSGVSDWSPEASVTTSGAGGGCVPDGRTLCLLDGRFEVRSLWRNPRFSFDHGAGASQVVPGSDVTGLFSFFGGENVELIVKMLDGRSINQAFWHFYGALSDVEYWISVRDTVGGASRTYHNVPLEICGRGDTSAFASEAPERSGAARAWSLRSGYDAVGGPADRSIAAGPSGEAGSCTSGPEAHCLAGGRFRVEVQWENPRVEGDRGVGRVFEAGSGDVTGHFWFFQPDNLELAVKILDGRAINDHFWILWGGLSDVGYTIEVTDTMTGAVHEFVNPPLTLCGGAVTDRL